MSILEKFPKISPIVAMTETRYVCSLSSLFILESHTVSNIG